ncbi:MAG TPA: hypothetical protein VGB69_13455 [Edaphobacter sp.]
MELYERQQFDFLLQEAVERYVQRVEQRNQGALLALDRLRQDREGEGVWMSQFVDAIFEDFLLTNIAGAGFVMRALASRRVPELSSRPGQTVEQFVISSAKAVFSELFYQKTEECLEQHASFEVVAAGTDEV